MRGIFYISISIYCLLSFELFAQSGEVAHSKGSESSVTQLILNWDNDCFVYTDYYYTNGLSIEVYSKLLKLPVLNPHLLGNKPSTSNYSISFRQNIYTPRNLYEEGIHRYDRPYASYLLGEYKRETESSKLKVSKSISLGVMGNISGGSKTQSVIHEAMEFPVPVGWKYEMNNAPIFNFNYQLDHILIQNPYLLTYYSLIGRVGNLYTDGAIGISSKIGLLNSTFNQTDYLKKGKLEFFLFASLKGRLSIHDATLQGVMLVKEPGEHYLSISEKYPFVGSVKYGAVASFKFLSVKASIQHISPEFKGGTSHAWGALTFLFRF